MFFFFVCLFYEFGLWVLGLSIAFSPLFLFRRYIVLCFLCAFSIWKWSLVWNLFVKIAVGKVMMDQCKL